MAMTGEIEITLYPGVSAIDATEWDSCACPEARDGERPFDPFTTHRFLSALEASGSVGPETGWTPCPLVARKGGEIIAVAPLYLKSHSQGEYVFDHGWADAFERAGGSYYPKLQCAVPFSPVNGRRLLTRPGHTAEGRAALFQGFESLATREGFSSAHVTFCTEEEVATAPQDWLERTGEQFHWYNRSYGSYDDFLADLASRKRKALRKERARALDFGGEIVSLTGNDIRPEHWQAMWAFYQDTGSRKWGRPYLTRAFFDALSEMQEDVLLILALRDGEPVAGALNLIGRDTLYGRYWGCLEDHAFLHFELCYHRAIDWAIAEGYSRVEAGAQGEHKLARGYLPTPTRSLHWIAHPGFRRAVETFLTQEREAISADISALTELGPYRHTAEG